MMFRKIIKEGDPYRPFYRKAYYDIVDGHRVKIAVPWFLAWLYDYRTSVRMWNDGYRRGMIDALGSSKGRTIGFEPKNESSILSPSTNTTL